MKTIILDREEKNLKLTIKKTILIFLVFLVIAIIVLNVLSYFFTAN